MEQTSQAPTAAEPSVQPASPTIVSPGLTASAMSDSGAEKPHRTVTLRRFLGSAARMVGLRGGRENGGAPPPDPGPIVPHVPERPAWYPDSYIPQADTADRLPFEVEDRDWRNELIQYLEGHGLEIGPLHRPMVRHERMAIDYLDRHTAAELWHKYSELGDVTIVEPDILDDAETLRTVPSGKYDFVIAAHVIEHMKNPLGALEQWARVLKPGGLIYLVVPDKRATFDVRRVRTRLEHMVLDYRRPSAERDFEHLLEYVVLVDERRGEHAFREAEKLAETDYPIHFHVFLPEDIIRLLGWFSNNLRRVEIVRGPCASHWSDEFHVLIRLP